MKKLKKVSPTFKPLKNISSLKALIEDGNTLPLEEKVNFILTQCMTSDFKTKAGINEAGFKMILLSIFFQDKYYLDRMDKIEIKSEFPVPSKDHSKVKVKKVDFFKNAERYNKYIDILLRTPKKVIILELKYVRLGDLRPEEEEGRPKSLGIQQWRPSLLEWTDWLKKLDKQDLLDMNSEVYMETKKKDSIKNLLDYVYNDQGLEYKKLYKERFLNIPRELRPKDYPLKEDVSVHVIIGMGNRCVIE